MISEFPVLKKNHYTSVARWAIFMEQKLRFALVLGRLELLKKNWADYEQLRDIMQRFSADSTKFFKQI